MRPLTYILGAVAGFFTFVGMGLIYKGFMIEGGITLVIGLLNLVQFIRFLRAEYLMEKNKIFVWYAGYGSNLSEQRFSCYIQGGKPTYGKITDNPCSDSDLPSENHPFTIPYRLYFALPPKKKKTNNWGQGGVAYIEPNEEKNKDNWTKGRIWKISRDQYDEVKIKEGASYNHEIYIDNRDGIPIITITNQNRLSNVLAPSESYIKTIMEGLMETYDMDDDAIVSYLIEKEGIINKYTKNRLMTVAQSVH